MICVYKNPSLVDILVFGVHPDDIELSCTGSVLRHIALGYKVGLVDLTKGELGTRGNAALRLEESTAAAVIQKVSFRANLDMEDGFFENSQTNLLEVIKIIRMARPRIILATAVSDRHPDHGRAAKLVSDAFFYSGLKKIQTDGNETHRADHLYHYIQDKNLMPDICVDVTAYVNQKMKAIMAYKSQFFSSDAEGPDTPISSPAFLDFIRSKMAVFGRSIRVDFAEGFNTIRTPGVKDLTNLI